MSSKITRKLLSFAAALTAACASQQQKIVVAHCNALDREVEGCYADCARVEGQALDLRRAAEAKDKEYIELHRSAVDSYLAAQREKDTLIGNQA